MSELTKEHFERALKGLATKADLKGLVTKEHLSGQLAEQTKELKAYAREQTEELARIVATGFEDIQRRLDLQQLVQAHELKLKKIEEALHINL